jgi:hypothetical protein
MVAAGKHMPIDPAPKGADLASLDAYRAWQLKLSLPSITDPGRVDAYIRDLVDIQPDGTVRPVMDDSVSAALYTVLRTTRRDYSEVTAPAIAIYAETMLDVAHGDAAQRAQTQAWEDRYMKSFRTASMARAKRDLKTFEIVSVPETHMDFLFTSRDRVVDAIMRFLTATPVP